MTPTPLHQVPDMQTRARKPVRIGSRYTRQHVIREDREAGVYEELNPTIDGTAALLQQALLTRQEESPVKSFYIRVDMLNVTNEAQP